MSEERDNSFRPADALNGETSEPSQEPLPIRFTYEPPKPPPPQPYRPRVVPNVVLFCLTLASTIYWGFLQYQQFYSEELRGMFTRNPFDAPAAFLGGLPFGVAVVAILLAHEMGHYLACRYYRMAATLPFFLPLPPSPFLLMPGTMGAVILIRSRFPSRRALFDMAIAGPIAGWVTALPILAYGLSQSKVVDKVEIATGNYLTLGEPLIWAPFSRFFAPEVGASQDLVMHPLAFVGWFALLITAFNLLPIGQLDGGHVLYSLLPRLHRAGSFAVLAFMLFAGVRYFLGWIVFGILIAVLTLMSGGFRHPSPQLADQPLGAARIILALIGIAIFATSFMIAPVEVPTIGFR